LVKQPLSHPNPRQTTPQQAAKSVVNVVPRTTTSPAGTPLNVSSPSSSGLFRVGQHARKLFIDNILSRVTTTYSEDLRQRATRKLFFGDSAPFFALIGVSLASGSGVLSKEDELEGVCWEIREAAGRLQRAWNQDEISETLDSKFSIDDLEIGPPIAKGCAAVVYAAGFKKDGASETSVHPDTEPSQATPAFAPNSWSAHEMMSPLQNMSRFVHNFGGSVDNIFHYSQPSAASDFVGAQEREQEQQQQQDLDPKSSAFNVVNKNL